MISVAAKQLHRALPVILSSFYLILLYCVTPSTM